MTTRTTTDDTRAPQVHRAERQKSTETKSAYKTTELIVYVLAVLGVLIASDRQPELRGGSGVEVRNLPYGRLHDQPWASEGRLQGALQGLEAQLK